jgi:hypothetical protein
MKVVRIFFSVILTILVPHVNPGELETVKKFDIVETGKGKLLIPVTKDIGAEPVLELPLAVAEPEPKTEISEKQKLEGKSALNSCLNDYSTNLCTVWKTYRELNEVGKEPDVRFFQQWRQTKASENSLKARILQTTAQYNLEADKQNAEKYITAQEKFLSALNAWIAKHTPVANDNSNVTATSSGGGGGGGTGRNARILLSPDLFTGGELLGHIHPNRD